MSLVKRGLARVARRLQQRHCKPRVLRPKSASSVRLEKLTPFGREVLHRRAAAALFSIATAGNRAEVREKTVLLFRREFRGFKISVRSLERWEDQFQQFGLAGLADRKQGRVGRKPKTQL